MKKALILLAGGKGTRFKNSNNLPKQFNKIGDENIIEFFLSNLEHNIFDIIVIVCDVHSKQKHLFNIKKKFFRHNIYFTKSGNNRQKSSKNGIFFLKKFNPKKVLIHDSARPLTSNKLIKKLIKYLDKYEVCCPYTKNSDLIKIKTKNLCFNNRYIKNIQTPQAFIFKKILKAHLILKNFNAKDDTSLTEMIGIKTQFIIGDKKNIKITYKEDLEIFHSFKNKLYKHGIGYDIHKIDYASKKKLTLCGVKIKHPPLVGHSDADVGYHALCDSILGSLSLRDIGYYFNNKNKKWKNANSEIFVFFVRDKLKEKNYKIINIDINFICESPNINKYANIMKKNISKVLSISKNIISIKATTNEKIGLIGKKQAIASECIVSIVNV